MITIQEYTAQYDNDLKELSKLSQKGNISFSIYREPSFLAGAIIQTKDVDLYVILKDERLIGCFNLGRKPLWYQGRVQNIRYLCDLKVHPDFQNGSAFIRLISKTYEIAQIEELPIQVVIFSDNHKMLKIVNGRKKKGRNLKIFHGHKIGGVLTTLIDRKNTIRSENKLNVKKAREEDKGELQEFINKEASRIDFFPEYDLEKLNDPYYQDLDIHDFYIAWKGGRIVGTFAIWDLRKIKQTVVVGYSTLFKMIKPFYNLWSSVTGSAPMVKEGAEFKNKYISCLLIENRDVAIYKELLGKVLEMNSKEDYHYLLSTLDVHDPLSEVHEKLRNKREIKGEFYVGDMEVEDREYVSGAYFYVEAARV